MAKEEIRTRSAGSPPQASTATATTSVSVVAPQQHCLICYTPFVEKSTCAVGITPCGHNEICAPCHLRLRQLHQDYSCPICKASNELIVVDYYVHSKSSSGISAAAADGKISSSSGDGNITTISHAQNNKPPPRRQKLYEEYPIWGNELGKEYILYAQHTFFPVEYYQTTVVPIIAYACHHCNFGRSSGRHHTTTTSTTTTNSNNSHDAAADQSEGITTTTKATLRQLQDHLRVQHRLTLCQVCTDHQRDFVSRLPRYNPAGLQKHYQLEHYSCPFCSSSSNTTAATMDRDGGSTSTTASSTLPFYDLNALYLHCHREHYRCHICETNLQITNQFYKSYKSLERHFDQRHYLCCHPTCLNDRFIVFYTDIDLAHHERSVHNVVQNGGSKIQLEFKFHRHGSNNNTGKQDGSSEHRNASNVNYHVDGVAFTPPSLPSTSSNNNHNNHNNSNGASQRGDSANNNNALVLHPQHAARTEQLRQQAASLRQESNSYHSSNNDLQHNLDESNNNNNHMTSSFPSLQETVTTANDDSTTGKNATNRLTIGWTADGSRAVSHQRKPAGVVTEEDFPSLITNGTSKTKAPRMLKKVPPSVSSTVTASKSNSNWTAAAAAPSRTVTPPIPLAYATMSYPSTTTTPATTLKQPPPNVNLSDKQSFPSLGVGNKSTMKKAVPYTAAQDFAASIRKSSPSTHMTLLSPLHKSATTTTVKLTKSSPDVSSVENFPSLTATSTKSANGNTHTAKGIARDTVGGSHGNSSTTLSIEALKGILGPVGYKAMKTYTREFVSREMAADSYIDHMASLFPNGYTDIHFWNFVPELIRSFPSTADHDGAFAYMENLHRMKNGALNHEANYHNQTRKSSPGAAAAPQPAKSSTSYATLASIHTPVPQQQSMSSFTPSGSTAMKVSGAPKVNSTNAWNNTGTTTANQKPPAVKAATATTRPTSQPATSNSKKKSNGSSKQKNELRALAFGS